MAADAAVHEILRRLKLPELVDGRRIQDVLLALVPLDLLEDGPPHRVFLALDARLAGLDKRLLEESGGIACGVAGDWKYRHRLAGRHAFRLCKRGTHLPCYILERKSPELVLVETRTENPGGKRHGCG